MCDDEDNNDGDDDDDDDDDNGSIVLFTRYFIFLTFRFKDKLRRYYISPLCAVSSFLYFFLYYIACNSSTSIIMVY